MFGRYLIRRRHEYVAVASGCVHVNGEQRVCRMGVTRVRDGDALLAAAPNYFARIDERQQQQRDHELRRTKR